MTLSEERVRRVLDVALRLGEVLLARQAGSADVADTISAVTAAYGLSQVQVNIAADAIAVSVPHGVPGAPVTAMWMVVSRSPDYTRLYEATQLAQRIIEERPPLDEVDDELTRLSRSGHPYPRWVSTLALAVMAAGLSLLLGGGAVVAAVAGVTTAAIDQLGRWLNSHRVPLLFQQVVGAAIAAGVTVGLDAVGRLPAGEAPSLVIAANIAVLLSGMATVGTMQDAITGYHLTATARGVEILLSSIGVLVGVTVAIRIGLAAGVDVAVSPDVPVALLSVPMRVFAGALAAAAAAIANYAPVRAALAAAGAGAAGSLLYLAATLAGAGSVAASFLAALGIGLAGALGARRLRVPPLVIAMAGIYPLVPGLSLYRGFVDLTTGTSYPAGLAALVTAAAISLALGGGVVL
ncbi:MAG TPA: threonine/serine exporter family protein, partial [Pseudonocardia sp.]|nr:threonine/serine exporter family protein [Pseudonocardia sp.]